MEKKVTKKKATKKKATRKKATKKKAGDRGSARPASAGNGDWDPQLVHDFVEGRITLGELQGFDKKTQYRIAEMGYNLFSQGRNSDATKLFRGLVALDPHDPYFLLACGSLAQKQGELDEADRWYSEALRHAPDHAVAYANRGEVRMELGRLQEGAADLIEALKSDPQLREPTSRRARALLVGIKATLDEGARSREAVAKKRR